MRFIKDQTCFKNTQAVGNRTSTNSASALLLTTIPIRLYPQVKTP